MVSQGAGHASEAVWTWSYQLSDANKRRRLIHNVTLLGLAAGCLIWAGFAASQTPIGDVRFPAVLAVIFGGLWSVGLAETRRALSTSMTIDVMGLLTVKNSQATSAVDLRTSSAPEVRLRSNRVAAHWSIETSTPEGGWHHELGNIASYSKISESEAKSLEAELQKWSAWARSATKSMPAPERQLSDIKPNDIKPNDIKPNDINLIGMTGNGAVFEWTPPSHKNASRNRGRTRLGFGGFALAVAIFAAVSEWENGIGTVAISMLAPALILLVGAGIDLAFRQGRNFRLSISNGVLNVAGGRGAPRNVPLNQVRSFTVISATVTNAGNSSHQTTIWKLVADTADGPVEAVIPTGPSSGFGRNEAIQLEHDLNQFVAHNP